MARVGTALGQRGDGAGAVRDGVAQSPVPLWTCQGRRLAAGCVQAGEGVLLPALPGAIPAQRPHCGEWCRSPGEHHCYGSAVIILGLSSRGGEKSPCCGPSAQTHPLLSRGPPVRGLSHRHRANPPCGTRQHGAWLGETPRARSPPRGTRRHLGVGSPGGLPMVSPRRAMAGGGAGASGIALGLRGGEMGFLQATGPY